VAFVTHLLDERSGLLYGVATPDRIAGKIGDRFGNGLGVSWRNDDPRIRSLVARFRNLVDHLLCGLERPVDRCVDVDRQRRVSAGFVLDRRITADE
jgi:hypothetical protein